MDLSLDRRGLFAVLGGAAMGAAAWGQAPTPVLAGREPRIARQKKAVKIGMVEAGESVLEKFKLLKELGFDGVELDAPSGLSKDEVLKARDATGLTIHGVVDSVHWSKPLSHPDGKVRDEGRAALEIALRDAKVYGATTVLLVPAVVNREVAYDQAWERSVAEIQKVLPLAAELQVKIALENVWNHFLLSPMEVARYIDGFQSPWIGAYFDVGNVVLYGWPEHWIRILGPRILKLDIKEYSRGRCDREGRWKGFASKIGDPDGDCGWGEVRKALKEIGYEGWATAEVQGGNREVLQDIKNRMDRVLDD